MELNYRFHGEKLSWRRLKWTDWTDDKWIEWCNPINEWFENISEVEQITSQECYDSVLRPFQSFDQGDFAENLEDISKWLIRGCRRTYMRADYYKQMQELGRNMALWPHMKWPMYNSEIKRRRTTNYRRIVKDILLKKPVEGEIVWEGIPMVNPRAIENLTKHFSNLKFVITIVYEQLREVEEKKILWLNRMQEIGIGSDQIEFSLEKHYPIEEETSQPIPYDGPAWRPEFRDRGIAGSTYSWRWRGRRF